MKKTNSIFNYNTFNGDRVRCFMLSSFFVFLTMLSFTGCGDDNELMIDVAKEEDGLLYSPENEIVTQVPVNADITSGSDVINDGHNTVFVHICGAVVNEGVYELNEDSRITDAVEMAGGFSEEACGEAVNLAMRLEDEQYIYIPTREEVENGKACDVSAKYNDMAETDDSGGKININTADENLLTTLTGIGKVKAENIIRYREQNGKFDTIEDIMKVSGIGPSGFEKIRDKIEAR